MAKKVNHKLVLTEDEAAKVLLIKKKTLQAWRYDGKGPKFLNPRPGFIRYYMKDLHDWIKNGDKND